MHLFVGNTDMNWHLLIMLESALKASPSNHHLKLLLMRVYCSMGKMSPLKRSFKFTFEGFGAKETL